MAARPPSRLSRKRLGEVQRGRGPVLSGPTARSVRTAGLLVSRASVAEGMRNSIAGNVRPPSGQEAVILPGGDLAVFATVGRRSRKVGMVVGALVLISASAAAAIVTGAISVGGRGIPEARPIGEVARTAPAGLELVVSQTGLEIVLAPDLGPDVRLRVHAGSVGTLASVVGHSGAETVGFLVGMDRVTVGGARKGVVEVSVPSAAAGPVHLIRHGVVVAAVIDGLVRTQTRPGTTSLDVTVSNLAALETGAAR